MSIHSTLSRLQLFLLISLVLLIPTSAAVRAQSSTFDEALAARLQSTLDNGRLSRKTVGISVAIISPRRGTWLGTSGTSEPDVPMRPEMLLGIGSITKTFTAAAILQMVDEGKLSLNDKVVRWLPPIPNVDTNITIRQMLQHTSGIYNYTSSDGFWAYTDQDLDRYISPEEILQFIGPRKFAPGGGWSYSNTNYLLLGMIIERISGTDYESEVRRRLIEPLSLASTAMGTNDELPGEIAHNWVDVTGDGIVDDFTIYPRRAIYSGAGAAGGFFSTAEDLAKWARALYGGGVLSLDLLAQMTTFRNLPNGRGYGLGAMRENVAGKTMWGHNGAITGYYSTMLYNRLDSTAFVAIINQNGLDAEEILAEVVAEYYKVSSVPDGASTAGARFVASHPNPFTSSTTIDCMLEEPGDLLVAIHTVDGRLVRTLESGDRAAGRHAIVWDGRDDAGRTVAGGAYIARIESGGRVLSTMVVKRGER